MKHETMSVAEWGIFLAFMAGWLTLISIAVLTRVLS